jgi:hypothetical protein
MIIYAGGEVSMEIGNAKWSHRLGKSDIENLCLGLFSENFIATPPIFEPLPFLLRFPAGPIASSKERALSTALGSKGVVQREDLSSSLHHSTF